MKLPGKLVNGIKGLSDGELEQLRLELRTVSTALSRHKMGKAKDEISEVVSELSAEEREAILKQFSEKEAL